MTYRRITSYNKKKIYKYLLGILIVFIHFIILVILYIFIVKSFLLPIQLNEFLCIQLFVLIILCSAFIFKRCILSLLENKYLKLDKNNAWGGKRLSDEDLTIIKKGYISKDFIKSNIYLLIIVILLYIKYLIELNLLHYIIYE